MKHSDEINGSYEYKENMKNNLAYVYMIDVMI